MFPVSSTRFVFGEMTVICGGTWSGMLNGIDIMFQPTYRALAPGGSVVVVVLEVVVVVVVPPGSVVVEVVVVELLVDVVVVVVEVVVDVVVVVPTVGHACEQPTVDVSFQWYVRSHVLLLPEFVSAS